MRGAVAAVVAASLLAAVPASAQAPASSAPFAEAHLAEGAASSTAIDGVIELFTSQGCASCPAADETLTALSADPRLLALSYHVDYWDYIGWKDPLGSPRNSERQRAYAKAIGHRSVFTPQAIVNGEREIDDVDRSAIAAALSEARLPTRSAAVELRLSKIGSTLHIEADAPAEAPGQTVLILVTYRATTATRVERGDNAGRHLVNSHSVNDWQVVGKMNGRSIELDMPIATLGGIEAGATGCAVLLQAMDEDGSPGPILAAASLAL